MRKNSFLFFFLILVFTLIPPVQAQEEGSITFQPSEMPNIGFEYNSVEYQFELTWKSYYLNVKPFAIYKGEYYELKEIIPWIKNNYPNVDYRTAVQKFKNYHRWGYWLEKLPQNVADSLDYLGFELDYNIPLSAVELEEVEGFNYTYKLIHIGNRFTLDFQELYERGFTVDINRTTILIGNVKGKTDLDLDPVTYSSPTITITGYTEGTPCTFLDIWNADQANGWDVVHNNNESDTQFQFDCCLQVGDGSTETWVYDQNKMIAFMGDDLWFKVKNNAHFTLGNKIDGEPTDGCFLYFSDLKYETPVTESGCDFNLYDTKIFWSGGLYTHFYLYGSGEFHRVTFFSTSSYASLSLQGNYKIDDVYVRLSQIRVKYSLTTPPYRLQLDHATTNAFSVGWVNVVLRNAELTNHIAGNSILVQYSTSHLIDCSDEVFSQVSIGASGIAHRQYAFDLKVTDKNGDPVQNADVSLTWEGQGGGSISESTFGNGSIPTQTLSKGFYNQTGGNTPYLLEPYNMTIETVGYLPHQQVFNISSPTNWEITLTRLEDATVINVKFGMEIGILFLGTIFWTVLFINSKFESIPNGVLAWMFSWGTGYYWLASNTALPALAWLFIIWGIVTLYLAIMSLLEYRKYLATR